ncbi:uncharacterized protein LOC144926689 [Branchiostoma floridae x Branchiostoma belcheri]
MAVPKLNRMFAVVSRVLEGTANLAARSDAAKPRGGASEQLSPQAGRYCYSDVDCDAYSYCDAQVFGQYGKCVRDSDRPTRLRRTYCYSDNDCGPSTFCDTITYGRFYFGGGICRPRYCYSHADCEGNTYCDYYRQSNYGLCKRSPRSPYCYSDSDCDAAKVCDKHSFLFQDYGLCRFQYCYRDQDCNDYDNSYCDTFYSFGMGVRHYGVCIRGGKVQRPNRGNTGRPGPPDLGSGYYG